MHRRHFIKAIPLAGMAGAVPSGNFLQAAQRPAGSTVLQADREYWVQLLTRIAEPVMKNLSLGQLRQKMPTEKAPGYNKPVEKVTYLEAFGRTMAGISPWLELGADSSPESKIRARFIDYALKATEQAVLPGSPDYMNFTGQFDGQPL